MKPRVLIAGGGLAGLSCAKALVDAGHPVEVWEGAPFLGGRASTFRDDDGEWVEQGLHLFLGAYARFRALLADVGAADAIVPMPRVRLRDPEGPHAVYGVNPLMDPVRTVAGVLGEHDYLGPLDKAALLPAIAPALLDMGTLARGFDGRTAASLFAHAPANLMERFVRPFCRAIQFTEPEDFSAFNFLGWIHHTACDPLHAWLGGYRGARDETIFAPLARYLEARGARIRTGMPLRRVRMGPGGVEGFDAEDGTLGEADAFVLAVPAWRLGPLLPAAVRDTPFFRAIDALPVAPAVSVQLWFDREVEDTADFTLVAHRRSAVYQDQATTAYPWARGSRISILMSPADDLIDLPDHVLQARALADLGAVRPAALRAAVVKSRVLKHPQHLIRPLPGAMSARPANGTPIGNLFLAGDWTRQDFFGSQEGAVRSGEACAAAIAARRG